MPPVSEPTPPHLPEYELFKLLGLGGAGQVWLGRRHESNVWHAVKIVRPSAPGGSSFLEKELAGLQRYLRAIPIGEPRQLALIPIRRDQNQDEFFAPIPDEPGFYYAMELADDLHQGEANLPGFDPAAYQQKTLKAVWDRARSEHRIPLSPREVVRLGIQLAEAVDGLHTHRLLHRDIKPGNVLYVRGWPKLADIGLIASDDQTLSFAGTDGYVPRDSIHGRDADLYAIGKVLYEMATGFDRNDYPKDLPNADLVPDSAILRELLNTVVERACHPKPAERYPSAAALLDDLRSIESGHSPGVRRAIYRRIRIARRWAITASLVSIGVLALAWRERSIRQTLAFSKYTQNLDRTAINLERIRFGHARPSLAEASTFSSRPSLEIALLAHQTQGDSRYTVASQVAGVDQIVFSSDGTYFAAAFGDYSAQIFSAPSAHSAPQRLVTLPNVAVLGGFTTPPKGLSLVGTYTNENDVAPRRPLGAWSVPQGRKDPSLIPGYWKPLGSDGQNQFFAIDQSSLNGVHAWSPGTARTRSIAHWPALDGLDSPSDSPIEPSDLHFALSADSTRLFFTYATGINDTKLQRVYFLALPPATENLALEPTQLSLPAPRRIPESISTLAISPNGQWAAYAETVQGAVVLGQFAPHEPGGFQPVHTHFFRQSQALAFSPKSDVLAVGGDEERIRLLPVGTNSLANPVEFHGHGAAITALAFSPDGHWLVSGDADGEIRVWSLDKTSTSLPNSATVVRGFKNSLSNSALIASPDEILLAAPKDPRTTVVLDARSLAPQTLLTNVSVPLAFFGPDNSELAALTPDGELTRIHLPTQKRSQPLSLFSRPTQYVMAHASTHGQRLVGYQSTNVVWWDLTQSKRLSESSIGTITHASEILDATFSPDQRTALTVSYEDWIEWDAASGQPIRRVEKTLTDPRLYSIAFVSSLKAIVVGAENGELLEYSAATGELRSRHTSPVSTANALIATLDGSRLLSAGPSGRLAVFQTHPMELLVAFVHNDLRRPGDSQEHMVKRLLELPRQKTIVGLTEDGLLVRW